MLGDDLAKIDIGDDLSVDDYEVVVKERLAHAIQRARCSEYFVFERVLDLDSEFGTVPQRNANRLGLMVEIDNYFGNSVRGQILDRVVDQRAVEKRYGSLGAIFRKRPKPGAKSRC